jgi:hypothetical protein
MTEVTKGEWKTLDGALEAFIAEHPDGWDHAAWERLLGELRARGLAQAEPQAIGRKLELARVRHTLETLSVKGLGPKRREVIESRYPRVWELKQAPATELAQLPSFNAKVAEELVRALH